MASGKALAHRQHSVIYHEARLGTGKDTHHGDNESHYAQRCRQESEEAHLRRVEELELIQCPVAYPARV